LALEFVGMEAVPLLTADDRSGICGCGVSLLVAFTALEDLPFFGLVRALLGLDPDKRSSEALESVLLIDF
jgi:hypothetical protein